MKRMPFTLHGKGGSGIVSPPPPPPRSPTPTSPLLSSSSSSSSSYHHFHHYNTSKLEQQQRESSEPRSVLDQRRSPSPLTSTSTSAITTSTTPCSSSLAATSDVAAAQHPPPWPPSKEDDWELQPLPLVLHDPPVDDPCSLLRWFSSDPLPSPSPSLLPDLDAPPPSSTTPTPHITNSTFDPTSLLFDLAPPPVSSLPPLSPTPTIPPTAAAAAATTTSNTFPFPPPNLFYQDPSPPLFLPITPLDPSSPHLLSSPPTKPPHPPPPPPPPPATTTATNQPAVIDQHQHGIVGQLLKAAEQIESGNPVTAHAILARLNHHLLLPPTPNPHQARPSLLRSASYFKDGLSSLLSPPSTSPTPLLLLSPWDVVFKLSAHKSFSDLSPIPQFVSFTCVQAILEELDASSHRSLHILDFDLGVGGHWSSLLQELSHRRTSTNPCPSLRITAFLSPSSHHPLELVLIQDNLSQFASDLGILFEFNALPVDSFELAAASLSSDEAFAVNLPVTSPHTSSPTFIHLLQRLSPRVVVSIDHGCNRSELSFSQYFLHLLRTYTVLLDSIDAANAATDTASRVGRFLLQPRIENSLLTRYQGGDKPLPWRALFASAGFTPLQPSNFAETQAECLLKRFPARGFHIENRQSSLSLLWKREELVSVSSWRC